MSLQTKLTEYIQACCTAIWIESHEHQDALAEIAELCRLQNWQLASWDCELGLQAAGSPQPSSGSDPLAAIRALQGLGNPDNTMILVLKNYHRYLGSAEIVQALAHRIQAGKNDRTFVLVLSPLVQIPPELEKMFIALEHELPNREQLASIARGIATEEGELPGEMDLLQVLDAASGLTRMEAENAFSLSLVRDGRIAPGAVWELKSLALKSSGLLSLYRGGDDFSRLGGLASLKAFCKRALRAGAPENLRARGVLLLSPPGCGKSQFCKALGQEVGRPVLILDVGSLMGALVGQTEERTRSALRIVDAMAPCVLMIDELEKAFSGASGSGDSGVAARMFGTFLSWLGDHESDVFVVCTSNDITKLPPEFSRSERFDGVFFLDLPKREEKDAIWLMYRAHYNIDPACPLPDDTDWTGAEIKACCRLAALLDVPLLQAARNVVPVAFTSSEAINRLRQWASGRCLSASSPGIFQVAVPESKSRRRTQREPSQN